MGQRLCVEREFCATEEGHQGVCRTFLPEKIGKVTEKNGYTNSTNGSTNGTSGHHTVEVDDDHELVRTTGYFDREIPELLELAYDEFNVEDYSVLQFRSGSTYQGQWQNRQRHGYGKQVWPDGACYEGQWQNNCASGDGRFTHSEGDYYIGQWHDNKAHGYGSYYHRGKPTYTGQWRCDLQHGSGIETVLEGARYE